MKFSWADKPKLTMREDPWASNAADFSVHPVLAHSPVVKEFVTLHRREMSEGGLIEPYQLIGSCESIMYRFQFSQSW